MDSMRSSTIGVAAAVAFALYGPVAVGQTAATSATESSSALEEVVITAQKRTEKLEDVPVAASVISSQALAAADIADLSDLNKLVPSVQLNGTINGRVPTGVRGISSVSNEQTVGISSCVSINIDGVPVPSDSFDANNVAGIQNVEVLLGPQSTLGGRTAASGLINLTTRGPTDTVQGFATTTVTDDGEYRIEGFLSGPVAPRIDASLSAYKSTTPYPITNTTLDQKTKQDVSGARAKLLVHVTDDFDITLMAHDELTQGQGFNFVYNYITPGNLLLLGPNPGPPFLSQSVLLPGITPSWNNLKYASPVTAAGADHRDNDYSAILEYRLPGGYTVTSTSAYEQEDQNQIQDLFAVNGYFFTELTGGHLTFNNEQQQITTVRQESEELKIVSPGDQNFSWLAGLFYSDVNVDELYTRTLAPAAIDDHVVPDTKTYDAYARATWKFLPTTSVVAGVRYNDDQISYKYNQYVTAPASPPPYYSQGSSSQGTIVGDVSLKQQFSRDVMGYVSYSRGYSPAAYNTSAVLTSNATLPPVNREDIDSFEIGTKGTYFDHTLTLNADIFDTIYTHYQIQSYAYAPGVLTPPLILTSVGKAETRGAEVAADWLALPTTRLDLSAAYIDAKFVTYTGAPCYGLQTAAEGCNSPAGASPSQNVSGDTMPNSPKFKFTLGAEQRVPLPAIPYELVLGGTYTYRTSAQMLPDQNPFAVQSAFGLLNLSASMQSTSGKYSITAFCNNVTNHHYYTDVEDFWSGPWGGNAVIGQPARDAVRYSGVRLSASL